MVSTKNSPVCQTLKANQKRKGRGVFLQSRTQLRDELRGQREFQVEDRDRVHAILADVFDRAPVRPMTMTSLTPDWSLKFCDSFLVSDSSVTGLRRQALGPDHSVSGKLVPTILRYPDHIVNAKSSGVGEDRNFLDGFFPELLTQGRIRLDKYVGGWFRPSIR